MAAQYIFTMQNLRKVGATAARDPQRHLAVVLPGAKIGVIGSERIGQKLAASHHGGRRSGVPGEARPADGIRIGYLAQRTRARPDEERLRKRRAGGQDRLDLLKQFEELSMRLGKICPPLRWTRSSPSMAASKMRLSPKARGTPSVSLRSRWMRCGCLRPSKM